ncbi:AMP-binding protein [Phenylobacterium sp.]|uniref:AMP-binding protein n=1 Tax=Phenylobacterium sp. TaxID=1871053 RepID=UPI0027345B8E|nr:AMP-binding protein [Phenylobacterium sp.]MDP3854902.1 AMP-binding protein [Phenylobacterium sp.]
MVPFTTVKDVSFRREDFRICWFADGVVNACVNCVDRHLPARADQTALIWEADDPALSRRITYAELHAEVCRTGNVLKGHRVGKGDRVAVYLPVIPEAAVPGLRMATSIDGPQTSEIRPKNRTRTRLDAGPNDNPARWTAAVMQRKPQILGLRLRGRRALRIVIDQVATSPHARPQPSSSTTRALG